jgi:hypothetical protein
MDLPHAEETRIELVLPGTENRHSFSKCVNISRDGNKKYKLTTTQLIARLCARVTQIQTPITLNLSVVTPKCDSVVKTVTFNV